MDEVVFRNARELYRQGDLDKFLDLIANQLRQANQYPELFEILKSRVRWEMGLALDFQNDADTLTESQQRELEDRLLATCLEIGKLLVESGNISDGWRYLQPIIDRQQVKNVVESVAVDQNNVDDVIEVALCQWAAPEFGFNLLLKHQGTCNGITFFDTQIAFQDKNTRAALAGQLTDHVYQELTANLMAIISDAEAAIPKKRSLAELIADRDWLFENCGHHLDVTHLTAVVRIARNCQSPKTIGQAAELCLYGNRLDSQLVYESEPPFENSYQDSLAYFRSLLNPSSDSGIEHFEKKLSQYSDPESLAGCIEVLVGLCIQTRRSSKAIDILLDNRELDVADSGTLLAVANTKEDFDRLADYFESQQDLLGFGLSRLRTIALP